MNNLLCLREARARGADEVVITNLAGEITEAAVSNIGFVREGELVLPPLEAGILAGITRRIVIDHVAPAAGVRVIERTVRPEELPEMQECFRFKTGFQTLSFSTIIKIIDSSSISLEDCLGEHF